MKKGQKLTPRYPWKEWFSRVKFSLFRDKDYTVQPYVMGQMVRNRAYQLGLRPHVNIHASGQIDVTLEEEGKRATDNQ